MEHIIPRMEHGYGTFGTWFGTFGTWLWNIWNIVWNIKNLEKFSGEVVSPFSFAHKFAHFHYIYRGGGLFVDLACLRAGVMRVLCGGGRYAGVQGA